MTFHCRSSKTPVYIDMTDIEASLAQNNVIMKYNNRDIDLTDIAPDVVVHEFNGPHYLISDLLLGEGSVSFTHFSLFKILMHLRTFWEKVVLLLFIKEKQETIP